MVILNQWSKFEDFISDCGVEWMDGWIISIEIVIVIMITV